MHHRRRQDLLLRLGIPSAMNDQLRAPWVITSILSRASSCAWFGS